MKIYLLPFLALLLSLIGCDKPSDDHVFTLYSSYRSNRLHVATFDASPRSWNDSAFDKKFLELFTEQNFQTCNKAAAFFQKDWDDTVKTADIKYWCEKGRYRK